MGTGSSFMRNHDSNGDEYDGTAKKGVVKRIPIEVKPRRTLATSLRSVGSLGRRGKGVSLRSALSVELDSPDVERIKKEFDMYKLNKDNEIANIQKKANKLENENKRMRAELQALQKTCSKLRQERDAAQFAEYQALERAATFENDRDKVQRQFKIFRETKESELQNLLKAKRELEHKLNKLAHILPPEDMQNDSASRSGLETSGNPGDWWTAIESEPSLGSTTQLQPLSRGPEFENSMTEIEGTFANVNKDEWQSTSSNLAPIIPLMPDDVTSSNIRIYVSTPDNLQDLVQHFVREFVPRLEKLCEQEGRVFTWIQPTSVDQEALSPRELERLIKIRRSHISQCSIFLAFIEGTTTRFTVEECKTGHLDSPGSKSAIICFVEPSIKRITRNNSEGLKDSIRSSSHATIIEQYGQIDNGPEFLHSELDRFLRLELGIHQRASDQENSTIRKIEEELEHSEQLCSGNEWDVHSDYQQLEALSSALNSSTILGLEKYFERLNNHVASAGLQPPLLVSGASGTGRSLLLAKWMMVLQERLPATLILYHFVDGRGSCSTDPVLMIRRLTAQLMQYVSSPPALSSDPVRLVDEFPRWLEKVSSRISGGLVLIIDSLDKFQKAEVNLNWLLDPLPVDTRIVVSVHEDNCPQAWRSWPTLHLEPLSNKNVKELLRSEWSRLEFSLPSDQEARLLTRCRTATTCNPLFVTVMASDICWHVGDMDERLDRLCSCPNILELYKYIIDDIVEHYNYTEQRSLVEQVLRLFYVSRNGLSESELMKIVPEMNWDIWLPFFEALRERHILKRNSGLITFTHEQAQQAVQELYLSDANSSHLDLCLKTLINYFSQFLSPGSLIFRVADELPYLIHKTSNKDKLQQCILDLYLFKSLYGRGRCSELLDYWQYIGADKIIMAKSYFNGIKKMEEVVSCYNGMVNYPKIAEIYEALGRFLRDLGLLSQAITPLQRALEIRETVLDPDHPSVAQALHQLGGLHAQWSKFPTAEVLYKQALEIYENALGSEHYLVAKELESLAVLYQRQDKHDLAEPLQKRSRAIRHKYRTPRAHSAYRLRGFHPLRRRAVQLEELALGPECREAARTLNELGVLYYLQKNIETAEAYFKRSLEMRESVLGPNHPDCAQSLKNLAALYNDQKEYDQAEPLYQRALQIRLEAFSPEHPSVDSIVKHLASMYRKQGKYEEAEPYYKQAVDIREKALDPNHPSVATALVNLAVLYCQQGKHNEALPLYERALNIYEESLGPGHPRVAETLQNLALLRYEQGDYETAAKLYKRSTDIKEGENAFLEKEEPSHLSSSEETNTIVQSTPNMHFRTDS